MKVLNKKIKFFLILIIVLAAFLHLFFLNFHPLALDEFITLKLLDIHDLHKILFFLKTNDTQQPLYYILLYKLFSNNLMTDVARTRLPALIFYGIGILVHYFTVKKFKSAEVAIISTALISLSFILLFHSTEVRMYSLLFLFLICADYNFLSIWKTSEFKKTNLILFIFFGFAATFTHLFGFIYFFTEVLLLLFSLQKTSSNSKLKIVLITSALLIISALILPDVLKNFNAYHAYRYSPTALNLLELIAYLFSGYFFPLALLLSVGLLFSAKSQLLKFVKSYWPIYTVILFPILLAFLKSKITAPAFEARYFVGSLSFFYLLTATYIHESNWKVKYFREGFIILLVLISIYNIAFKERYFIYPYRVDSKGVAEEIIAAKTKDPSVEIVSCNICPYFYIKDIKFTCIFETAYPPMKLSAAFDTSRPVYFIDNIYPKKNCEETKKRFKNLKSLANKNIKWVQFYKNY